MNRSTNAQTSWLGIDLGTSGCRAILINQHQEIIATSYGSNHLQQSPQHWWQSVTTAIRQIQQAHPLHQLQSIAVDATATSCLLLDQQQKPISPVMMYNDLSAKAQVEVIKHYFSSDHAVCSPASSLAKLLHLAQSIDQTQLGSVCHQVDWINGKLTEKWGISDWNNTLKLGYDSKRQQWPSALIQCLADQGISSQVLPLVKKSGEFIGYLSKKWQQSWGLSANIRILAGTTDSTAAVRATGIQQIGEAVTSLGSSMVLKILSDTDIQCADFGVYSQPYDDFWLVGGASNSGGAVLKHYFDQQTLNQLTPKINVRKDTGLNYYPLLTHGERFPINDPDWPPRMTPIPNNPVIFLQGLLEGMSHIEQQGYQRLQNLGAPKVKKIYTLGGGSHNTAWLSMRQQRLGKVVIAEQTEAAFGSALMALMAEKIMD